MSGKFRIKPNKTNKEKQQSFPLKFIVDVGLLGKAWLVGLSKMLRV